MSRRAVLALLVIADVLAFGLTIHAHLTWRRAPGGPAVMPVTQVLGWVVSIGILLVIAFIIFEGRQAAKYRRRPY